MSKARIAAFHALRALARGQGDLPAAVAGARRHLDDDRDRGLAMEVITGAIRWQRSLDHLIAHFAARPLARIDPDLIVILRLSVYQLLHLDRVPAAAVVDDAVDLARLAKKGSAAGFVNAVLRTIARERHRLPLPPRPEHGSEADQRAYLGVTHSHPDWLVSRWLARIGFENTERWVRFNNAAPALTLRVNRLHTTREALMASLARDEVETTPTTHAPDGLVVTAGNPLRLAQDGSFFVQDEASQLVTLAVGAGPGHRVLDVCASPGGKSVAMAGDMQDRGLLVACDVRERRIRLLRETVRASATRCVRLVHLDGAADLPFTAPFDRVLVDAPCSGLGTLRRDPDIRWRRHEEELASLAQRQVVLLTRAAAAVAPGGRLIYATCSSEPEENEAVVERFLAAHPSFSPIDLRSQLPERLHPLVDGAGALRTSPLHGLEAFYAAAMVR